MALTKETTEDKIEVVGDYKAIQIRTATVIKDDGTEISRSFHRKVIHPCVKSGDTWSDTDTSSESAEVQAIASAVWTDAVKTAYKTMVDAQSI
jgi:virulence-associated protein VagC